MVNFTWWVNRKDRYGKNVFEGGFLGLDNIGVFDRSAPLPTGGYLEQADGTAWMALFCQNMLEMAVEIAADDPDLRGHGRQVRRALPLDRRGDEPGRPRTGCGTRRTASTTTCCACPTARATRLKVRSLVGLLPLCATTVIEPWQRERVPQLDGARRGRACGACPSCCESIHPDRPGPPGLRRPRHLALVNPERLRRILARMLDENEFLSPYGIRALSRYHHEHPYVFHVGGEEYRVGYLPGGVRHRHVRRQLELARARSGCR